MNHTYDERTPMRNHLAELDAAAQAAGERARVANARAANQEVTAQAEREVLAELRKFRDDTDFRLREPGAPEEEVAAHRAMTERIVSAVLERGLVFAPAPGERQRGVWIVDPSVQREAREAQAEADRAVAEMRTFERENAEAMAEEADAVSRADFAAAIRDADVESAAGILTLTQEAQRRRAETEAAAMTTRDLPAGPPTRRHAPI